MSGTVYNTSTGLLVSIDGIVITSKPSPNVGGELKKPTLLVMHFTGSGGADGSGDAGWFQDPKSKVSAHFVVGRDGSVTQCVPLNRKAWHAGKSIWRGVPNCNDYSIGIEVDNWGLLQLRGDGKYYTATGAVVPSSDVLILPYKGQQHTPWEAYKPVQLTAVERLTKALREYFPSLTEIAGHEDIAPGRKIDPGPAFPMARMVSAMDGRDGGLPTKEYVNVPSLNLRSGPSTSSAVLQSLAAGTAVWVLYESDGWAHVETENNAVSGYVASKYLRTTA